MTTEAPTINEIVYQAMDRLRRPDIIAEVTRFSRYHVGDLVAFDFNGLRRYGRITNVMNVGGIFSYNIDAGRTWYRDVAQDQIKGLAAQAAITTLR
jgi:hypothetical protein